MSADSQVVHVAVKSSKLRRLGWTAGALPKWEAASFRAAYLWGVV